MVKEEEELIVADKTDIDFNGKLYNSVVEPEHNSSSREGHVDNNEKSRKSKRWEWKISMFLEKSVGLFTATEERR